MEKNIVYNDRFFTNKNYFSLSGRGFNNSIIYYFHV